MLPKWAVWVIATRSDDVARPTTRQPSPIPTRTRLVAQHEVPCENKHADRCGHRRRAATEAIAGERQIPLIHRVFCCSYMEDHSQKLLQRGAQATDGAPPKEAQAIGKRTRVEIDLPRSHLQRVLLWCMRAAVRRLG